jgi:type I restriction enzyme S subunit
MLLTDSYIVSHLAAVIPRSTLIERDFLLFTLRQKKLAKEKADGYPTLNLSDLKSLLISYPPLPEQRAIAHVLRAVQQAKEATEKVIAAARQLKQSMMQYLFTYGPVPFDQADQVKLKETEIGIVPEHWEIVQIGDVAKVQGGFAFKSNDYVKEGIRLLRISNVSFGKIKWNEIAYLQQSFSEKYDDYILRPGDLVMAITRPVVSDGIKVARLNQYDSPSLLNQRVCRFIPKNELDLEFLFQMLFNKSFVESISGGAIGSQQPNISTGKVEKILIPKPPKNEQNIISSILQELDIKIEREIQSAHACNILFQTLLQILMSGDKRKISIQKNI